MSNPNGWGDGSVNNNIGWGQGANNSTGWGKSHLSSWSGATDIDGGDLPVNSVAPAITGTAQEGQTLTCSTGTWSGSPTYTYQWKRNGNNIGGATSSTYLVALADVGQSILCTVTATNFVGSATANSNTVTPTSSTDADAQAFITAASITDPTQQSAINTLVTDLKGYGLWTKMKVVYPFVGGTSTSHSYNLRNTAQFQITWVGGVTHSSNGVQYNGTNSYGNTNFNCNNTTILNNCAGAYSRTNNSTGAASYGGANASNQGLQLFIRLSADTLHAANDFILTGSITNVVTDSRGFFIVNRESNTIKRLYRNGTSLISSDPSSNSGTFNGNLFLGARNSNGSTNQYDNKQYAFNFVSDTLTATEITNLTTAVQAFQTALSRQV